MSYVVGLCMTLSALHAFIVFFLGSSSGSSLVLGSDESCNKHDFSRYAFLLSSRASSMCLYFMTPPRFVDEQGSQRSFQWFYTGHYTLCVAHTLKPQGCLAPSHHFRNKIFPFNFNHQHFWFFQSQLTWTCKSNIDLRLVNFNDERRVKKICIKEDMKT